MIHVSDLPLRALPGLDRRYGLYEVQKVGAQQIQYRYQMRMSGLALVVLLLTQNSFR